MRTKALLIAGAGVCVIVLISAPSQATDWADKFTSGRMVVRLDPSTNTYRVDHFWNHTDADKNQKSFETRQWSNVGAQTLEGRSNTVERLQTDIHDFSTGCGSITTSLVRWRKLSPPAIGTTCSVTGLTSLGSVDYTVNTCPDVSFDSHRNLPEWNFSSEGTQTRNTFVGYYSRVWCSSPTCFANPVDFLTDDGCFTIYWF